jgi:hypothetical protein
MKEQPRVAKAKASKTDVRQMLETFAREQFPESNLENVLIEYGEDADGDPILRITVIFSSDKFFDPVKASGFVRHLRPKLRDDNLFPLVSFVTAADHRRQQAAAH